MDYVSFGTGYTYRIMINDLYDEVGPDYHVWVTEGRDLIRGSTTSPFSKRHYNTVYFAKKDGTTIDKEEAMRLHDGIINLAYAAFLDNIEGDGEVYEDNGKYGIHYYIDSESG